MKTPNVLSDLFELIFPQLCITCENRLVSQEKWLCLDCWYDLPLTNFHLLEENKVAQLFWGRTLIVHATAFFSYRKGSRYQSLLHAIKYRGMKELGFEAGKRMGIALATDGNFKDTDVIVPVPLHPKKLKFRGYNQSEWIARGIASGLNREIMVNKLIRTSHSSTQTKKNRYERWKNVEEIFDITDPDYFSGKHILLVDDVVTTGSTLDACASQLLKIQGCSVSIATLAFAEM